MFKLSMPPEQLGSTQLNSTIALGEFDDLNQLDDVSWMCNYGITVTIPYFLNPLFFVIFPILDEAIIEYFYV